MNSSAVKRITRELDDWIKNPPKEYTASPVNGDLFHWTATLFPPKDSAYKDGKFHLNIIFPPNYPFKPINITFTTKIYHPNVSQVGSMCLEYDSREHFCPLITLKKCLEEIYSLFTFVNCRDVFDHEKVVLYQFNPILYIINVKEAVEKYALE